MLKTKKQLGFTLIELLVVVSVIGLISSMILVQAKKARISSRDARRIADMHQLYNAIYYYYDKFGSVPTCSSGGYAGGCDVSSLGTLTGNVDSSLDNQYVEFLRTSGFMSKTPKDPLNAASTNNFYIYNANITFPAGSTTRYLFLIGTSLEDPNNPALRTAILTPGYPTAYMLGVLR
ncbi:MAG: type II secretion system GspH family protein [Candidatus Doudnabacteria bacterium]|nr:type II secretion system GspH family protein [Candidatus Doudnabacteria bacterium]